MALDAFVPATDGDHIVNTWMRGTEARDDGRVDWSKVLTKGWRWQGLLEPGVGDDMSEGDEDSFARCTGEQLAILQLDKFNKLAWKAFFRLTVRFVDIL